MIGCENPQKIYANGQEFVKMSEEPKSELPNEYGTIHEARNNPASNGNECLSQSLPA